MTESRQVLTADHVHILQHSLGLDRDHRDPWRNYYAAEDGDPALEALVSLDLMTRGRLLPDGQGLRYYHVTDVGIGAALARLPPRRSRASQRFRRFLNARDAMPDLTFRDFLRMPEAR